MACWLADVVSDSVLHPPFAYLPGFDPLWIGAVIVLSSISELAGVHAPTRRYGGPMGKSDRALAFGAIAFWLGIGGKLAPAAAMALLIALMGFLGGLVLSAIKRDRGITSSRATEEFWTGSTRFAFPRRSFFI